MKFGGLIQDIGISSDFLLTKEGQVSSKVENCREFYFKTVGQNALASLYLGNALRLTRKKLKIKSQIITFIKWLCK